MLKMNYLLAKISEETLAFPATSVLGIHHKPALKNIPHLPKHVLGVTVIRNQALPVAKISEPESNGLYMVVDNGKDQFALPVKKVVAFIEINAAEIKAINLIKYKDSNFAGYSDGLWEKDGEKILLINPEKLVWTKGE